MLQVKNLSVGFENNKGVNVIEKVSFELKKGEILGIVGESGSGKSVTANSIMRLLPKNGKVNHGEIIFNGENLLELSEKHICRIRGNEISMIYQEPMTALNPLIRIGDQIKECICTHEKVYNSELKERVIKLLDMVKIPEPNMVYKKYPHELSGGMRQRVIIAMAIACNPKIIIADEPTTALDVTIQIEILNLLKDISDELGTSIIIITHDLGVIAELADRVIVMYCGEIVEEASIYEFFDNTKHPYSKGLMLSRPNNIVHDKLYYIKGMVPKINSITREKCTFSDRCPYVKNICTEKLPRLIDVNNGHRVRCVLAKEGETNGARTFIASCES